LPAPTFPGYLRQQAEHGQPTRNRSGGGPAVRRNAVQQHGLAHRELSAANGYTPGINTTPGIGHPDPFGPGLVVLLSTTPQAAGGPDANPAGVFQLADVAGSRSLAQVFADWEVAKAGAFGAGTPTTLTAYFVNGTAPGS
jgi:hypothetical protein